MPHFVNALRPIDWRYTNDPAWVMRDKGERLAHNRVWMKADGPMPDDPVMHTAALVYSSDTTVLDSIITTHGLSWGFDRIFAVTMNHSVWFHRPVRFDEWVLYSTSSPVAADSRGLGTGHFFDRSGQLLATVVQEGIVKYFPGSGSASGRNLLLVNESPVNVAPRLRARERVVVHVDSPAARWIGALAVLSLFCWLILLLLVTTTRLAGRRPAGVVADDPRRGGVHRARHLPRQAGHGRTRLAGDGAAARRPRRASCWCCEPARQSASSIAGGRGVDVADRRAAESR